jgi:hypothetical protein
MTRSTVILSGQFCMLPKAGRGAESKNLSSDE